MVKNAAFLLAATLGGCLVTFEDYEVGELAAGAGGGGAGSAGATGGAAAATAGVSGSAGSGGSSGVAGTAGTCATGESCVAIPSGWAPVILTSDGVQCPADWNQQLSLAHQGLTAPQACDPCPCAISCGVIVTPFTESGCSGDSTASFPHQAGCDSISVLGAGSVMLAASATCAPSGLAKPQPVSWTSSFRVCAPSLSIGCPSGTCLPAASNLCVQQAGGSQSCPPGFTFKQVLYTSVADGRSCASCTCGSAAASCTGSVVLHTAAGCSGVQNTCPATGCCDTNQATYPSATISLVPAGSCSPQGGAFSGGAATESDPITVCCQAGS